MRRQLQDRPGLLGLLAPLSEEERYVLTMRMGLEGGPPLARGFVAEDMDVSSEAVAAIERTAMLKLRARCDLALGEFM